MDFDTIFGPASAISKQFEARWFFDAGGDGDGGENNKDVEACKMQVHRMPFQRRNLSYWVGIQYGVNSSNRRQRLQRRQQKQQSQQQMSHLRHTGSTKRSLATTMATQTTSIQSDGNKPLDLLHEIWKHRVRNYNDAFLESPRRNTRNYSKRTPTMEDVRQVDPYHEAIEATTSRRNGNNNNQHHVNSSTKKLFAVRDLERTATAGENDNNNHNDRDKVVNVEPSALSMQDGKPNDEIPETNSPKSPVELAVLVSEPDDSMGTNLHQYNNTTPISELDDMNNLLAWTKQGSSDHHQGEFIDASAEMRFHFLYFNDQRQLCFQTDATPDSYIGNRRCVFCYFDGGSNAGLLMHCVTCHGHFLSFKAARNEDGTLHIAVTKKITPTPPDKTYDFIYIRRRPISAGAPPAAINDGVCVPSVPFVKRRPFKTGAMDLTTRRKKMRLMMEVGADEKTRTQFVPTSDVPIRQYFHSRSNEPILEGEWDEDSDDEEDEGWLTKMSEELMDEFEDVTPQEKCFAKIWNRFMTSHVVIADHAIPSHCVEFIRTHSKVLVEHDLRSELMLHFMGFWDAGLISSTHLMNLMAEFDKLSDGDWEKGNTEVVNNDKDGRVDIG